MAAEAVDAVAMAAEAVDALYWRAGDVSPLFPSPLFRCPHQSPRTL